MKFFYKDMLALDTNIHFVVCPSNYPDRFRRVKVPMNTTLMGSTEFSDRLADTVRSAFMLEPVAEVILEYLGSWENVADTEHTMPHPFEADKRVKIEVSR